MHAKLTPHDYDRLRGLALARAAQLRTEALRDAWSALGRWRAHLFAHAPTHRRRSRQEVVP